MNNQKGSAIVMGVMVMLIFGIMAAGLLPWITSLTRQAPMNKDVLESQYVAEAGAKRAIVAFQNMSTDWSWIGSARLFTDSTKTYNVSISPAVANGSAPAAGTYTITSVGKVGQATKTVIVTFVVAGGGDSGPIIIWTSPTDPNYKNTTKFAGLANGDVTAYNNNNVVNSKYGTSYQLGTTAKNISFQWGLPVSLNENNVYLNLLTANFFSMKNPQFKSYTSKVMDSTMNKDIIYGSSWGNLWSNSPIVFPTGKTIYEVQDDVVINTDYPLTTVNPTDKVIIYSHGNITINQQMQGNFVFIADGTITLNNDHKNKTKNTGQIELYSKGTMTLNNSVGDPADGSHTTLGVFMTMGELDVHGNYFVRAFMYGQNYVLLDGGGTITGAVYSNGPMRISGGLNLTYDETAIPK